MSRLLLPLLLFLGCGDPDRDGDGFPASEDCDDDDPDIYPGAPEYCDDIDWDCSGRPDDPYAIDAPVWYVDSDRDGYGDPCRFAKACTQPSGWVANGTDCDDGDPDVGPSCSCPNPD